MAKEMDAVEQRALQAVAAKIPADNFNFPADEVPAFLSWVLNDFAEAIRAEVESNRPPF